MQDYAYGDVNINIYISTRTHIYTYICVLVCVYIYIIYTYTHLQLGIHTESRLFGHPPIAELNFARPPNFDDHLWMTQLMEEICNRKVLMNLDKTSCHEGMADPLMDGSIDWLAGQLVDCLPDELLE